MVLLWCCGGSMGVWAERHALAAVVMASGFASSSSFTTSNDDPFAAAMCSGSLPSCTAWRAL